MIKWYELMKGLCEPGFAMYSGFVKSSQSGNLLGTHQKLNRVAHRYFSRALRPIERNCETLFDLKLIHHFEGYNGPDGLKYKSPGQDEPCQFYNPYRPQDNQEFFAGFNHHRRALAAAIRSQDRVKTAYEAAWLSHVITDGMTPAHHYPYEAYLANLRGRANRNKRVKLISKVMIGVDYDRQRHLRSCAGLAAKNWALIGPRGLLLAHGLFELGLAIIFKPLKLKSSRPTDYDLKLVRQQGLQNVFEEYSRQIADYNLYGQFLQWGWTAKLVRTASRQLAPLTAKMITLAWYDACRKAYLPVRLKPAEQLL